MMKILHTSDWHLGRVLHGHSLLEDQMHMLDQILAELEQGYDVLVVAGDIFDRAIAPAQAMTLLSGFFDRVGAMKISVVMIPGNHDSWERLSYGAVLFEKHGIHIRCGHDRFEPVTVKDPDGFECDFFTMPFVEHARVAERLDDAEVADKESAVRALLGKMHSHQRKDVPSVLVAHEFIAGSEQSESERVFIGGSHVIDASLFNGFTYVALGHLHKNQEAGRPHIYYSGSPLAYSFGEVDNKQGMLAVSIDRKRAVKLEQIPIHPKRPMSVLEDTFKNLMEAEEYALYTAHYVSARVTDSGYHLNLLAALRERFPFLLEVRLLEVERRLENPSTGPAVRSDDPEEVFEAFLDYFGWDEKSDERELAQGLYAEASAAVQKEEVEQ